jgi:hypothetical protein
MHWYALALFLHVTGAICAAVSLGVWLVGLAALRRTRRVEQVRAIAWLIIVVSPVMVLSVLLIIAAGLAMALSSWGLRTGWIAVALGSLLLMAPIGPLLLDARMRAILARAGAEPAGPLSDLLAARTHDPIMGTAAQTLAALLLGIVFLMTTKPALVLAITAMIAALALGLLSSLPLWRGARHGPAYTPDRDESVKADPYLRTTFWTRRW